MHRVLFGLFFVLSLFCEPFLAGVEESLIPVEPCAINRTDRRKGEVAISTIFRDEAEFLKEWIEYHRLIGVSHFYLYNNLSQDHFWEVLEPYVRAGIVELFDVPFDSYSYADGAATHNQVQVHCYNHALRLAKGRNKWVAIIDSDEFICPVVDKDLPHALSRYKNAGGLVVYWQIYGTSKVWELEPGELLIEKLVYKEPNGPTGLFKSIVRPDQALCLDPHLTRVSGSRPLVAPNGQRFSHTPGFSQLPIDIIRINHYTYRTESYYYNVKRERRARWGFVPSPEQEQAILDAANSEYDPVMLRFVNELKKRISDK